MPSEWAMRTAREVVLRPEFTGTTRIYIHRGAQAQMGVIAEALDAARAQGMEEAAIIAETSKSRDICLAIRARIAQLKEPKS